MFICVERRQNSVLDKACNERWVNLNAIDRYDLRVNGEARWAELTCGSRIYYLHDELYRDFITAMERERMKDVTAVCFDHAKAGREMLASVLANAVKVPDGCDVVQINGISPDPVRAAMDVTEAIAGAKEDAAKKKEEWMKLAEHPKPRRNPHEFLGAP